MTHLQPTKQQTDRSNSRSNLEQAHFLPNSVSVALIYLQPTNANTEGLAHLPAQPKNELMVVNVRQPLSRELLAVRDRSNPSDVRYEQMSQAQRQCTDACAQENERDQAALKGFEIVNT